MKVIELLNKIANREDVPDKIFYGNLIYCWTGLNYYNQKNDEYLDNHICIEDLEQYIEIIEDKKIEPIKYEVNKVIGLDTCIEKINEIIDKINKGE